MKKYLNVLKNKIALELISENNTYQYFLSIFVNIGHDKV